MKYVAKTGIFASFCLLLFMGQAFAKDRVAIMDFQNRAQYRGWRVGSGASDMLATALVKTGKFSVYEREKLASILKEQELGASGVIDQSTASQIGKVIGVEYIITGAVTEYGQSGSGGGGGGVEVGKKHYSAAVDVRMVNATTGEIVFADTASKSRSGVKVRIFGYGGGEGHNEKKSTEALRMAIDEIAQKITSLPLSTSEARPGTTTAGSGTHKVPPSAAFGSPGILVADVDGNIISLNNGSDGGLKTGQTVVIKRQRKVIKDPKTGKVIKIKYNTIGTIKLTEVDAAYAEGTVVSGTGFQVNDVAKAE
ncbi:MAG: hypothetical protein GY941_06275 [Planctomycetes bacterium]|nr:hypothetical protein [Planctomycetota bacterium]